MAAEVEDKRHPRKKEADERKGWWESFREWIFRILDLFDEGDRTPQI